VPAAPLSLPLPRLVVAAVPVLNAGGSTTVGAAAASLECAPASVVGSVDVAVVAAAVAVTVDDCGAAAAVAAVLLRSSCAFFGSFGKLAREAPAGGGGGGGGGGADDVGCASPAAPRNLEDSVARVSPMSSSVKRLPEGGPRRLYALWRAAWSRNSAGTVSDVANITNVTVDVKGKCTRGGVDKAVEKFLGPCCGKELCCVVLCCVVLLLLLSLLLLLLLELVLSSVHTVVLGFS